MINTTLPSEFYLNCLYSQINYYNIRNVHVDHLYSMVFMFCRTPLSCIVESSSAPSSRKRKSFLFWSTQYWSLCRVGAHWVGKGRQYVTCTDYLCRITLPPSLFLSLCLLVCLSVSLSLSLSLSLFLSLSLHSLHLLPTNTKSKYTSTSLHCRCAVTGILSSILLTDHSLNWYYLSVVTGALGVVWTLGLRALTLHSLQNHKTHYKLSDGKRYTALSNVGRGRGGNGGRSEGPSSSTAANGLNALRAGILGSDSPPSPGGTAGGLNISGSSGAVGESSGGGGGRVVRDSSKERLKLDVRPSAMMTSCSQLPLRNFIKQPPVL